MTLKLWPAWACPDDHEGASVDFISIAKSLKKESFSGVELDPRAAFQRHRLDLVYSAEYNKKKVDGELKSMFSVLLVLCPSSFPG